MREGGEGGGGDVWEVEGCWLESKHLKVQSLVSMISLSYLQPKHDFRCLST